MGNLFSRHCWCWHDTPVGNRFNRQWLIRRSMTASNDSSSSKNRQQRRHLMKMNSSKFQIFHIPNIHKYTIYESILSLVFMAKFQINTLQCLLNFITKK